MMSEESRMPKRSEGGAVLDDVLRPVTDRQGGPDSGSLETADVPMAACPGQLMSSSPLGALLAGSLNSPASAPATVLVGELVAIAGDGSLPVVSIPGPRGPSIHNARTVVDLSSSHAGRQVVLLFERGDPASPIVMGVLNERAVTSEAAGPTPAHVILDGEKVIVHAKEQLVLQCGDASITLTRAGKIILRGAYVSSRASGVLRLRGGSVQIN